MAFKYDIIRKKPVEGHEEFPKAFLGDTEEEAEKLYHEFSETINQLSYNYSMSTGLDKSDLFGEALIGLARAKKKFDIKKSDDFKTYAIYLIKDAMSNYVRKFGATVVVPAYIKKSHRHINQLRDLLHLYGIGKEFTDNIICGDVASIPTDIEEDCLILMGFIKRAADRAGVSVETLVKRTEFVPHDVEYVEEFLSTSEKVEDKILTALIIGELKKYMTMEELEISEMIMEGKTYDEIGSQFGKTAPWVVYKLKKFKERIVEKD